MSELRTSYQEKILEARKDKYMAKHVTINEATRDCFAILRIEDELKYIEDLHGVDSELAQDKFTELKKLLGKYNLKP